MLLTQNGWWEELDFVAVAEGADHDELKGSTAEEADVVSLGLKAGFECSAALRTRLHDGARWAKEALGVEKRAMRTLVSLASA